MMLVSAIFFVFLTLLVFAVRVMSAMILKYAPQTQEQIDKEGLPRCLLPMWRRPQRSKSIARFNSTSLTPVKCVLAVRIS